MTPEETTYTLGTTVLTDGMRIGLWTCEICGALIMGSDFELHGSWHAEVSGDRSSSGEGDGY